MTHNNNNDDAQAGARVVVPRGSFKTGSVMLRSNLDLHLEAGAGLYGSDDWSEYPVVAGLPFGTMFRALISGYNLTNVSVTGSNLAVPASGDPATDSIIDGVGWSWWCIGKHMPVWPVPYCQHFNPTNKTLKKGLLLPKLVELFNCSGVTVSGYGRSTYNNSRAHTGGGGPREGEQRTPSVSSLEVALGYGSYLC